MSETAVNRSAQVPVASRFGFSSGSFSFVMVWQGTALFLMYFYTDVLGIDPVLAGTIYLIAMIWDAITDPIFATFAERTRTRWGRYRPWIGFGAIPFGVSYVLAFSLSPLSFIPQWTWILLTHLLLRSAFTAVAIPFNSLQARMTDDANERAIVAGFRSMGGSFGGIGIAVITPPLVGYYMASQGGTELAGYFAAACVAGSLATLGLLYTAAVMREPDEGDESGRSSQSILRDFFELGSVFRKNTLIVRLFSVIIIGSTCVGMFGKGLIYYFKYLAERPDLTMLGMSVTSVMAVVSIPLWVFVARRSSKRNAMLTGLTITLVAFLTFFIAPVTNLPLLFISIGLIGVGGSALPLMFWAMIPDTVEYGELMTGIRAEARTFGFATFAQKSAVGLNALIFGCLLSLSGFIANQPQTETTLIIMKATMALVPAAAIVVMIIIMRGYWLDADAHHKVLEQLHNRRGGG